MQHPLAQGLQITGEGRLQPDPQLSAVVSRAVVVRVATGGDPERENAAARAAASFIWPGAVWSAPRSLRAAVRLAAAYSISRAQARRLSAKGRRWDVWRPLYADSLAARIASAGSRCGRRTNEPGLGGCQRDRRGRGVRRLLRLARRSPFSERFAKEVREHDEAFKFLGVGYAVLLAFVVISAYTSYNDAKSGAEAEAEAVLQLSRTAEAFSPEQLERPEGVLVCYGRAVIHDAWPAMQEGESSTLVNDWGTRFRQQALRTEADTFVQRASFQQLLTEQDSESRAAAPGLPRPSAPCPSPCGLSCC